MAISSIYQSNKSSGKRSSIIVYILIVIGLLALLYFGYGFIKNLSFVKGKSSLIAESLYGEASVYLNDELLGTTPYTSDNIKSGENKLTFLRDAIEYEVTLNFLANTDVVSKRDLGVSQTFSSGQNFWFEKSDGGTVLSVISEPTDADVYIDGTKVGTTPYSSSDLSEGDYDLRVEKRGYESQSARIDTTNSHKLNISMTLFPKPVPDTVDLLEGSTNLYDVNSDNLLVTSDPDSWAKAVVYWNGTRGVNLAGVGVNKEKVFDYFIDYEGSLYDGDGNKVTIENAGFVADATRGAYLRKASDGAGLSDAARATFLALGQTEVTSTKQATVLETGTGWLRVRSAPSLEGEEVTTVNVGDTFVVLEEDGEWVKIKVDESTEGWVSATYVEITGGDTTEAEGTEAVTETEPTTPDETPVETETPVEVEGDTPTE